MAFVEPGTSESSRSMERTTSPAVGLTTAEQEVYQQTGQLPSTQPATSGLGFTTAQLEANMLGGEAAKLAAEKKAAEDYKRDFPTQTSTPVSTPAPAQAQAPTVQPVTPTAAQTEAQTKADQYKAQAEAMVSQNAKYEEEQTALVTNLMTYMQSENKYLTELANMKFEYNPLEDASYIQQAQGLENQIANIMVGRGGLYSSVTSAGIQSALTSLQISKTAEKWSEYKDTRNFTLNMAQNEQTNRNNYFSQVMTIKESAQAARTAQFNQFMTLADFESKKAQQEWSNNLAEQQFKADQQDKAFQRTMQLQQFQLEQANAKFVKEQTDKLTELQQRYDTWVGYKETLSAVVNDWSNNKKASADVVWFLSQFDQDVPQDGEYSYYGSAVVNVAQKLAQSEKEMKSEAFGLGQFASFNSMINKINTSTTSTTTTENYEYVGGELVRKTTTK